MANFMVFYRFDSLDCWRCQRGRFSYIIRYNSIFDKYLLEVWRNGIGADMFAMNTFQAAKEKARRCENYYKKLYGNRYERNEVGNETQG